MTSHQRMPLLRTLRLPNFVQMLTVVEHSMQIDFATIFSIGSIESEKKKEKLIVEKTLWSSVNCSRCVQISETQKHKWQ